MTKSFSLDELLKEKDKGTVLSKYLVDNYGLEIYQLKEGKYSKTDWLIVNNDFLNLLKTSGALFAENDKRGIAKIYQNGRKIRVACGGYGLQTGLKLNKITEEFPEDFQKEFK